MLTETTDLNAKAVAIKNWISKINFPEIKVIHTTNINNIMDKLVFST